MPKEAFRWALLTVLISVAMLILAPVRKPFLFPAQEMGVRAAPGLTMTFMAGPSEPAVGTITSNVASTLTFTNTHQYVIVSNRSGQTAYLNFNTGVDTVNTSVYDCVLDNGEDVTIDGWLAIEDVTVYVSATSGIRVVGW